MTSDFTFCEIELKILYLLDMSW